MRETSLEEILRSPLDDMPERRVPPWVPVLGGFAAAALLGLAVITWLGAGDDVPATTVATEEPSPEGGATPGTEAPQGTGTTTATTVAASTTVPEADIAGFWFGTEAVVIGEGIALLGGYSGRSTFGFRVPLEPTVLIGVAEGSVSQLPGLGSRLGHDAVLVPDPGRIVVFGGGDTSQRRCQRIFTCPGQDTDDLLVYDLESSEWEQVAHTGGPAPRFGHTMVFHPPSGLIVLHGGAAFEDRSTGSLFGDTWTLDPATMAWEQRSDGPDGRVFSAMAHDPETGNVLLFGGDGSGDDDDRLWSYDVEEDSWTVLDEGSGPGPRWEASLAVEPVGGGIFLSGGTGPVETSIEGGTSTSIETLFDVWEWTGGEWISRNPVPHEAEGGDTVAVTAVGSLFSVTTEFGLYRYDATADEWLPHP